MAIARVLRFARDEPEHGFVETEQKHDQTIPTSRSAVAREHVEEGRRVLNDVLTRREQREIRIDTYRLLIIITDDEVNVTLEAVAFLADDEQDLGVGLEAHEPVHHVH